MAFSLPSDPSDGQVAPASWGDAVRAALQYVGQTKPACRLYQSAGQSISNDTDTTLLFDSEAYDSGMHSTSSNTGRITFTDTGIYLVTANLMYPTNGTGYRWMGLRLNGSFIFEEESRTSASVVTNVGMSLTVQVNIATPGDYFEVRTKQTSGGALSTVSGSTKTSFSAIWMRTL